MEPTKKPRVWILTRDYAPHRSGGVRRVEALAAGLVRSGFLVTVLASTGAPDRKYPAAATGIRAACGKFHLGSLFKRAIAYSPLPDEHALDWPGLLALTRGLDEPDLLLASAPPHSLFFVAALLATQKNVPWVADFRDPWTEHPTFDAPSPLHRMWLETIESWVIQRASAYSTATVMMADSLRARVPFDRIVHPFLNGYDSASFEIDSTPPPRKSAERITVGFYGSIYGALDPEPLVKAVVRAGARLQHAGSDFDRLLLRAARKHGLAVESLGLLSPKETALHIRRADVLAMILPDDSSWAYCRTQKLAEYIGSGRPILALVPPGEAAEVLEREGAGLALRSSDIAGAAAAIHELAARPTRTTRPVELTWDHQVAELSKVLRSLLPPRAPRS